MKPVILEGSGITKKFEEADTPVLNNVNIELYDGDFTVIMGASGAGKSTLLYSLSGMNAIDEGKILYNDDDITTFREKQKAKLRSDAFGFVFQQTNLVSNLTLLENVAVAGYLNKKRTTNETDEKVKQLLKQMDVAHAMDRLPSKVSGGEAQRAAIARAIINDPKMLFADEPTGALDQKSGKQVMELFEELNKEGVTIVMITHDAHVASKAKRVIHIIDGMIQEGRDE